MEQVKGQYGRIKGASWFGSLFKKDIMILGAGGIGSWLSIFVSRLGCNLYIYDMDIYEEHNMSGQAVVKDAIGKLKTEAIRDLVGQLSPDCEVVIEGQYDEESMTNDVVLCGFDNMAARKLAFHKWREMTEECTNDDDKKACLFMDGRLNAEQLQILTIRGDQKDKMEEYEKDFLFADDEVADQDCTFKQTSHNAGMIAGLMTSFLVNWSYNVNISPVRVVPFFYEFIPPLTLRG
jgi:tRNA A37 threonylcarbamoyladenosine dehydratase